MEGRRRILAKSNGVWLVIFLASIAAPLLRSSITIIIESGELRSGEEGPVKVLVG